MRNDTVRIGPDDIIIVDSSGDKTVPLVQAMGDAIAAQAAALRGKGKPVLVLDDLRGMGQVPPECRRLVVELAKTLDYDRVAMVGTGGVLRIGANLMFQASGRSDRLRYFDSYDAAVAWLLAFRSQGATTTSN